MEPTNRACSAVRVIISAASNSAALVPKASQELAAKSSSILARRCHARTEQHALSRNSRRRCQQRMPRSWNTSRGNIVAWALWEPQFQRAPLQSTTVSLCHRRQKLRPTTCVHACQVSLVNDANKVNKNWTFFICFFYKYLIFQLFFLLRFISSLLSSLTLDRVFLHQNQILMNAKVCPAKTAPLASI